MNELALFAGAGGGILGGHSLGWKTVCAVEIEDYPRKVLLQRQRDGLLQRFPIWDDIRTFDGRPWSGHVDIITGGFPCQDISAAGKGVGIEGERSGLWGEMARVVGEVRPQFVFVENSPMLTSRGLGRVLGDLAKMGYDARWCVLGADDAGAPHRRKRIWILAYPDKHRCNSGSRTEQEHQIDSFKLRGAEEDIKQRSFREHRSCEDSSAVAYTRCKHGERGTQQNWKPVRKSGHPAQYTINQAVKDAKTYWPTPTASEDAAGTPDGKMQWMLTQAVKSGCRSRKEYHGGKTTRRNFPTPTATDSIKGGKVSPRPGAMGLSETTGGKLNPDWVEWLMGWPIGWTSLKPIDSDEILSWNTDPADIGEVPRVGIKIPNRAKRLKAIGNGQVPAVAALAFSILSEGIL